MEAGALGSAFGDELFDVTKCILQSVRMKEWMRDGCALRSKVL